ncbi:hypothetical protein COL154_000385 [Colletotrichum chrysophilum]|uniref:Myb-like domain-containing protein n=1 Tax=Colletotrichum chrysophilum TaxID=1836956 RepID=A0AAD9ELH0_9PEZI|nr:uncharacterized protein COL26b_000257 [Colletotrichum chrysophilum]KAJ0355643.1 hypothetical protein KNSL1_000770 [Colletotrichum chrysophilum]KAJ0372652.1 hypothetical protein COL154_000385 [Colletotrichum chrysophilum]KAJ0381579.1 hypothetical protein COL26b_000257 [Colletotrichum chrysophilum]KAK1852855.1 hypothetical protein CCHR01_04495 [Colletotrichum chrysophilum]
MTGTKAGGSHSHNLTVVKDNDDASSTTAVTIESDSDASSTITLVDLFPDLAILDSDAAGDTSAESTDATSSQVSSTGDEQSTDADNEACAKKSGDANSSKQKGKAVEVESESAETSAAESTSGNESTSEATSSEAGTEEAAAADSTTSGEASSSEVASTDGASDASTSAKPSTPGNWTDSEDALIISMKEGGETWAAIGNAMNRGKNEVKKRWHVVKANRANSTESGGDTQTDKSAESTEEKEPGPTAEEKQSKGKELQNVESTKPKNAKDDATGCKKKGKEQKVACDKEKIKEPKQKKQKKKPVVKEPVAEKSESEDDDAESSSYRERMNLLRDTSSESESPATSGDDADAPGYYEREVARQERYIRRHVHPQLYPVPPAARAPSPADKRQRRDDAILAAVASRREATKWLEMQANFFNVTGRMVPLHLIKARCEAEEDRGKAAGVRTWASSVAGSQDLLDPEEQPEVPEDALLSDDD